MARPKKQGFDYFPLDVDWWNDDKIHNLEEAVGDRGSLIYLKLLSNLYEVGCCYRWNDAEAKAFTRRHRVERDFLDRAVNAMLEEGLFDLSVFKSTGFLTSKSIQQRALSVLKSCKRMSLNTPSGVWLLDSNNDPSVSSFLIIKNENERERERESKSEETRRKSEVIRNNPEEIQINSEETHTLTHSTEEFSKNPRMKKPAKIDPTPVLKRFGIEQNHGKVNFLSSDPSTNIPKERSSNKKEPRAIEGVSNSEDQELNIAKSKLQTPLKQNWVNESIHMNTGRVPMIDYSEIFLTAQELKDVLKSWESSGIPQTLWRTGFQLCNAKILEERIAGKKTAGSKSYAWLLGWVKKELLETATQEARLGRATR